jgi:hypothetical protein
MNEQFVNSYIETMSKKLEEMTRSEVMLLTRLAIAEKAIATFQEENIALKAELAKYEEVAESTAEATEGGEF